MNILNSFSETTSTNSKKIFLINLCETQVKLSYLSVHGLCQSLVKSFLIMLGKASKKSAKCGTWPLKEYVQGNLKKNCWIFVSGVVGEENICCWELNNIFVGVDFFINVVASQLLNSTQTVMLLTVPMCSLCYYLLWYL